MSDEYGRKGTIATGKLVSSSAIWSRGQRRSSTLSMKHLNMERGCDIGSGTIKKHLNMGRGGAIGRGTVPAKTEAATDHMWPQEVPQWKRERETDLPTYWLDLGLPQLDRVCQVVLELSEATRKCCRWLVN
jgi:hypothetical protein